MVHNGIEYADMQLIAEAYDLLRRDVGLDAPALAEVFAAWNEGPLASFLIEITAKIFRVTDGETGRPLVDLVLDQAGQKGTGKWTVQVALDLGVPVPAIAAAVEARVVSSRKEERVRNAGRLAGPAAPPPSTLAREERVRQIHDALYAAKIGAYAQGMDLIAAASAAYGWGVRPGEMARIWKGGCIIRAKLLDGIMRAYQRDPALPGLLLDAEIGGAVQAAQGSWRAVVARASQSGIPVAAMGATLAWYDAIRAAELPHNLTQAQRDAFGAHTYQRRDRPERGFVHTDWLKSGN
jgi:6-phosphogluconate dehydrogenase